MSGRVKWKTLLAKMEAGGVIYTDLLPIIAACYITRKWKGEPLWLLIVGPPGTGKTLPLTCFSPASDSVMVSAVTPAALISGWGGDLIDRSLLKELENGEMLIAKDFGTILSLNWATASEVFAILREAFDGHVKKVFGHLQREFFPHFNMVAATTEGAEKYSLFVRS